MEKKARAAVKRGSRSEKVKKWLPLYLMMLPGAIYLIVNNYIPMFGMIIAFKKVDFSKGRTSNSYLRPMTRLSSQGILFCTMWRSSF